MRETITAALTAATKAQDKRRVSTLRLVSAAIKDRDIAARGLGKPQATEAELLELFAKMIKQREESEKIYRDAGRTELATQEAEEIAIIREFLPKQLSDADIEKAIAEAIAEAGATSVKDMGKVMAALKSRYAGQMDFGKASALVKAKLGS
jgi:uncharacterized protein YqeY